jgi:hypothetical protein
MAWIVQRMVKLQSGRAVAGQAPQPSVGPSLCAWRLHVCDTGKCCSLSLPLCQLCAMWLQVTMRACAREVGMSTQEVASHIPRCLLCVCGVPAGVNACVCA